MGSTPGKPKKKILPKKFTQADEKILAAFNVDVPLNIVSAADQSVPRMWLEVRVVMIIINLVLTYYSTSI